MLFGLKRIWNNNRAEAILFLSIMAVPYLIWSTLTVWADETWGPRYLHSSIPFGYIIGAAALEDGIRGLWSRICLVGLGIIGGVIQLLGSIYYYGSYAVLLFTVGLNNQVNFIDEPQTSAWLIHLQMLISQINRWLFNHPVLFDYKVYYYTYMGTNDNTPRNLVPSEFAFPRVNVPSPDLADFAAIQQWWWRILGTPPMYNDQKILAAAILTILLGIFAFSMYRLARELRACSES
jgi:hypothetical protein